MSHLILSSAKSGAYKPAFLYTPDFVRQQGFILQEKHCSFNNFRVCFLCCITVRTQYMQRAECNRLLHALGRRCFTLWGDRVHALGRRFTLWGDRVHALGRQSSRFGETPQNVFLPFPLVNRGIFGVFFLLDSFRLLFRQQ